jgi:ABC-type glycerol-3-phosphate transport system substrate-binding protein
MRKKIILVLMVALMLTFTLTGCLDDDGNNNPLEGDGDIVYDADGNVVYNNINLKMWSVTTGDDANTQDKIVNEFNKMYKGMINVTVEHYSRYDLETLLSNTMQFDKKNAPDMLFNHGSKITEYNERGWLQQVDFFFGKSGASFDKSDFVPSLLESVTIEGTAYGVPIDCHSAIICIREDILEKNNLPIPTNYEELCSVADQAAELARNNNLWIRGDNSEGYGSTEWRKASTAEPYTAFPISYGDMWVHEFVDYTAAVQNGGAIVDSDGMPAWNTQQSANGLQVLRDWIFPSANSTNESALSKDYGSSYDVGDAPFESGKCIFKLQGPWAWQKEMQTFDQLLAKDGGSSNITTRSLSGMFAKDSTKEYASLIKGEGHAITLMNTVTSYTKAAAATVFMDYMANSSGIEWAKRGHLPAVLSVALSDEYLNNTAYDDYIKYWGEPENYVVVPPTKYYSYVDTYFKAAAQKSIANAYKTQSIKSMLEAEYKSCLDYIRLYS